jgi:uncharacterized membrane protein
MCATVIALIFLWPGKVDKLPQDSDQRAYGDVVRVVQQTCPPTHTATSSPTVCGSADVVITSGPGDGRQVTVDLPQGPGAPSVRAGDKVILGYIPDAPAGVAQYSIVDHQRGRPLTLMLAFCALVIVAFGRWRGLTALGGLAVSFAALLWFIIPAILNGEPPLLVAVVGSSAIMFAVLYLTHGISVETSVAVLGTLASLVLTGLLATVFTATTQLTGFGSEESVYLSVVHGNVDMRGLLLAGIIIGALGVLDDVTVTQAATVSELARTAQSRGELYGAAIRIGRAHVASAVNTIVLAYAGASLPLLLLITVAGRNVGDLLTSEFIAQEIVRSAVGTVGLVASVPITTALATLVAGRHPADQLIESQPRHRLSG